MDPALERKQLDRLQGARARRDGASVERALAHLRGDPSKAKRVLGWRPISEREVLVQKGIVEPCAEFLG